MYNMELNLFGFKFNLLNALIFLVVGFLIATMTVCSCARVHSVGQVIDMIKGKKSGDKKKDESQ